MPQRKAEPPFAEWTDYFELDQQNCRHEPIMNKHKLLKKILASAANVRFGDMVALVEGFGFRVARVSGGHHIFEHPAIPELVNMQNRKGKAKPYQIRQFLELVEQHNLELGE